MLTVGKKAPAFTLPDQEGKKVSLKDFKGKKLVLYFYPKDDTPGCTTEACSFRDNMRLVTSKKTNIVGISIDSVQSHKRFQTKYALPFPLLSDESKKIVKLYGVWKEKNMYGKKYMGIERTTFIIDENGVIIHIFIKVKVDGHIDKVLEVIS
ncbi:MAG: thioredoxin-dependent thiol peroxidase [Bacteroidota bacterium]